MKILLAAPQDRTVLGIIGGYCRKALEDLGHEVATFDFRQRPYSQNRVIRSFKSLRPFFPSWLSPYDVSPIRTLTDQKINRLLLDRARTYKPDILLVLCGENILPATLMDIKKSGSITVNWFPDTLLSPVRQNLINSIFPYYDYLFIIDSIDILRAVKVKGKNIYTLPLACDPDVHRRLELSEEEIKTYGSDLVFVGTVTPEREKILEPLASDFNLKIWGRWNRISPRLKGCYQKQDIYGEEAVKVYNASKIIIDIHTLYGQEEEIFNVTPRLFEVPASGAFLLTNYIPQGYDFYKAGEEIITYKDIDDLRHLIRYYLEHPGERKIIAERAYQRAHREHTYLHRLRILLNTVIKRENYYSEQSLYE